MSLTFTHRLGILGFSPTKVVIHSTLAHVVPVEARGIHPAFTLRTRDFGHVICVTSVHLGHIYLSEAFTVIWYCIPSWQFKRVFFHSSDLGASE